MMKRTVARVIVSVMAIVLVLLLILQSTGLAAPIVMSGAPVVLPEIAQTDEKPDGDFMKFVEGLDCRDVYAPAKAVKRLDELYPDADELIPDEFMLALITFIESASLPENGPEFTGSISYPKRGLLMTDLTLDGMRTYYDSYLEPEMGEGMLSFRPDYLQLGRHFYDRASQTYRDFFEMRFKISFFNLEKLFDDGVAIASQYNLIHASEIYGPFAEKYPELAKELGITSHLSFINDNIK